MANNIVSVSAAPYDGYSNGVTFDHLAACGAMYVEPAFIAGYSNGMDEEAFELGRAARYLFELQQSGLQCHVLSSHMDLGRPGICQVFMRRMDFARHLGARLVVTYATHRDRAADFYHNIEVLARHAEANRQVICLENAGDQSDDLINNADDGISLIKRIGSDSVRLNFDPGNLASHREIVDPIEDSRWALPHCAHMHLKDVRRSEQGWNFTAVGSGELHYGPLLNEIAKQHSFPVSIELPLRIHRGPSGQVVKRANKVPLDAIDASVRASLSYLQHYLSR